MRGLLLESIHQVKGTFHNLATPNSVFFLALSLSLDHTRGPQTSSGMTRASLRESCENHCLSVHFSRWLFSLSPNDWWWSSSLKASSNMGPEMIAPQQFNYSGWTRPLQPGYEKKRPNRAGGYYAVSAHAITPSLKTAQLSDSSSLWLLEKRADLIAQPAPPLHSSNCVVAL